MSENEQLQTTPEDVDRRTAADIALKRFVSVTSKAELPGSVIVPLNDNETARFESMGDGVVVASHFDERGNVISTKSASTRPTLDVEA